MLLNAAKCQGYTFYCFWVIKGKPTGGESSWICSVSGGVTALPPPCKLPALTAKFHFEVKIEKKVRQNKYSMREVRYFYLTLSYLTLFLSYLAIYSKKHLNSRTQPPPTPPKKGVNDTSIVPCHITTFISSNSNRLEFSLDVIQ